MKKRISTVVDQLLVTAITALLVAILLPAPARAAQGTKSEEQALKSDESQQLPFCFSFGFHWCGPAPREGEGPVRQSVAIRRMTDLLERYGIRAQYGFVGASAQQLAEDYPDTVAKMRALKVAIAYHGGPGHNPLGPYGPLPDVRSLSTDDAIRALWTFETHASYPNGHPQAGQLMPGVPGGFLAIQTALGVTPLQTDAEGRGALFEALGAGYPMSSDLSSPCIQDTLQSADDLKGPFKLPGLHEIHAYGENRGGSVPPTYFGLQVGELSPVTVDILEWFRILADNLPRDRTYVTGFMSHAGIDWDAIERLADFLKSRDDFRITAPDPKGWQWEPENSPLTFYQKRYGVKTLGEVMTLPPPVDAIRPGFDEQLHARSQKLEGTPQKEGEPQKAKDKAQGEEQTGKSKKADSSPTSRPSSLSRSDVLRAADYILSHWPQFTHDGDFGGPPQFVRLDEKRNVSLAEAFQAFVRAIDEWSKTGKLPESMTLKPIQGPVDFPTYRLAATQTLDYTKRLQGYEPHRVAREELPDPLVVASQGLPACGDHYMWIQTHTKADADDVISAVKRVAESMTDHVPGSIKINLLCHAKQEQPNAKREVSLNPAEFLYGIAQQYRALATRGKANDVVLVSLKVAPEQVCKLIGPEGGTRFEGFIYRGYLSAEELDVAWTRTRRN